MGLHVCQMYRQGADKPVVTYTDADSKGRGDTCPHFYKWLGTGGTVSRKTANKKLAKLY